MFDEFKLIDFENSASKLQILVDNNRQKLKEILKINNKTYKNFVVPYELMSEQLNNFYTLIFHIDSVKNSKITQKVYTNCLPIISLYETEILQNEKLYRAFRFILDNEKNSLNIEQIKVLENEIKKFKLGGCGLKEKEKDKLKKINLALNKLSQEFSQNILDDTTSWEMVLENYEDVKDIPKSDLKSAEFKQNGKIKYKFTLQMPSYIAYITYGTNRDKREEIYKAYTTRASQNGKLIEQILKLKDEKAKILGFDNYSQYSLQTKTANDTNEVLNFLEELVKYAKNKAKQEILQVQELAKKDGINELKSYDLAYYSEKLKKINYDIDQEYYRSYFEQNSVLNGLFKFLNKLFDIEFRLNNNALVWDESVKVYDMYDNNQLKSRLYIDLNVRNDKKSGAWMNNWHSHYNVNGKKSLATAFVICNFSQLLRHDDVVTLFHEIGHALHHLLSNVNEPFVSGVNEISWDVVEFPSQFLEYFAFQKDVLKLFAKHYKTKEVLDDNAIEKLIKAKNFQSSLALMRQLEFALFDFKLHLGGIYTEDKVQKLLDDIRMQISPLIPPAYNKFQNQFGHIFSGGYSAGYYSYKWAEVLSADAFCLFLENGIFNKQLALKYKQTILAKGSSIDMNELYQEFANKKPDIKSLLKIDGII